jgi:hypothetical protein
VHDTVGNSVLRQCHDACVRARMALVTLQALFQEAFPAYEQTHSLLAYVRRAVRAFMQCRTAALGGHIQACPDGPQTRVIRSYGLSHAL